MRTSRNGYRDLEEEDFTVYCTVTVCCYDTNNALYLKLVTYVVGVGVGVYLFVCMSACNS